MTDSYTALKAKDIGDSRFLSSEYHIENFSFKPKKIYINKNSGDLVNRTKGNCTKWHSSAIPDIGEVEKKMEDKIWEKCETFLCR